MSAKNKDRFGKKCGALGCTESRVYTVHGYDGKKVLCSKHAVDYAGEDSLQLTIEAKYGGGQRVQE